MLRFPLGCMAATFLTTCYGSAIIGDGAMAVVIPTYNLPPVGLEVAAPLPDLFQRPE
ncbi:hypothetical protein IMZ48_25750 [Candidatus Bathyarchaeota archaeon]|nr:hypothetical protein [Candidatus Bathyarchaeota archaeon]